MAYGLLLIAQLAIGAAAIFARFALQGTGPLAVSALRLTIAAVPLFIYSLYVHKKHKVSVRHEILFALAGLGLSVHFGTWIAALQFTSVAVATLLVSTAPVWTALYDVLVLKKKISNIFWLAFCSGVVGTVVIVTGDTGGAAPIVGHTMFGNFLSAAGGLAFGGYLIAIRSIATQYPTMLVVGRTYSWAAAVLVLAALIARESPPGLNLASWGGILGMALISQTLGHTGINASLRSFNASTVAFSTLLEPVFAALLGALILSEPLSLRTIFGSVIVLIALALVLREQGFEEQSQIAQDANQL